MVVTAPVAASRAQAAPATAAAALPAGTRLQECEVIEVIGAGGFGIVYRAYDRLLDREVAIKEYLPAALAERGDGQQVRLKPGADAEAFAQGLRAFVAEAQLLARLDHPAVIKAQRFWQAGGTAYMAMPLVRARTLEAVRRRLHAPPSERTLMRWLAPLLDALEALHARGVIHRDVSPDNILIGEDGAPVLIDFGAARFAIDDALHEGEAILKPNFAPVEQHGQAQGLRQGPWTDLYGLGATLYFAITGTPPQPATARAWGSGAQSLAEERRPGLSMDFLRAVDWMLAPHPGHRPQSVAELRAVLGGRSAAPIVTAPTPLDEIGGVWEHTVARDAADDPRIADMAALLALRADTLAGPRPRAPAEPPGARWRRTMRRQARQRRRAGLWALLVLVALGAAAWHLGWWDLSVAAALLRA